MILLDHLGIVQISGVDAPDFLQRQLSNDVSKVSCGNSSLGAYLTPKGRIIANFLILSHNQTFLLVLNSGLMDSVGKRIKMFVLRDKVEVSLVDRMIVCGGYLDSLPESMKNLLPRQNYQCTTHNDIIIVRIPGTNSRFYMIGAKSKIQSNFGSFDDSEVETWKLEDIECGIASIGPATTGQLVPQANNLDLVGGVSFKKGCYPGQEIVARLHYRGGVNRRLLRANAAAEAEVEPGALVQCQTLPGNQTALIVNNALGRDRQHQQLLVSTPLKFIQHKILHLDDNSAVKLLPYDLPYKIPKISD